MSLSPPTLTPCSPHPGDMCEPISLPPPFPYILRLLLLPRSAEISIESTHTDREGEGFF